MAVKDAILAKFEKVYADVKAKEAEGLHNDIVEVLAKHQTSIENTLFVLDLLRFELMEAKYKEVMGLVKLTEKPPVKKIGE